MLGSMNAAGYREAAMVKSAAGRKTLLKSLRENVLVEEGDAEDFAML